MTKINKANLNTTTNSNNETFHETALEELKDMQDAYTDMLSKDTISKIMANVPKSLALYKSKLKKFTEKHYYLEPNSQCRLMDCLNKLSTEEAICLIYKINKTLNLPRKIIKHITLCLNSPYNKESGVFNDTFAFDSFKIENIKDPIKDLKVQCIKDTFFAGKNLAPFLNLSNFVSRLEDVCINREVKSTNISECFISLCNNQITAMKKILNSEAERRAYSTEIINTFVPEPMQNAERISSARSTYR
jgi:hypothetical protein